MQNNDNNLPVQYYYRDVFSDGFMRITTDHCPLSTTQYFLSPRHENNGTLDRANGMSDYANRERRHSAAGCRATRVCLRTTERMK